MEASIAAQKVPLGGGSLSEAIEGWVGGPVMWACLLALGLNLTSTPLPSSIDMVRGEFSWEGGSVMRGM